MPHLSKDEVKRFYGIWFPLLHYVNQKKQLVKSFPAQWRKGSTSPEDAFPLREALWAEDSLREAFIAENPASLSPADLSMVESWQYRVKGHFFIFRYLKKYAVFISDGSPARAYGVLGLTNDFEDFTGPYLPVYVDTVLLPFEDRIIYDSLISPYSILFGGGIKSDLNFTYRLLDEREGVVTTLLPDTGEPGAVEKKYPGTQQENAHGFSKGHGAERFER